MMDPSEDFLSIVIAEEKMNKVAEKRQEEANRLEERLKGARFFARRISDKRLTLFCSVFSVDQLAKLEASRAACTRPPNVPTPEVHVETLNALETAQRNLMKGINNAEGALAEKEGSVSRLRKERATLEVSDPAVEHELDASTCVVSCFFLCLFS